MLLKRIEEVSLNAWPALQQILYDGWILRFSKGYTKRANSVNPLWDAQLDVVEKIDYCENLYAKKNLRTIFRLTPFAIPVDLDNILADRDYKKIDPTLVMALDLRDFDFSPFPVELIKETNLDTWLATFCQLSGYDLAEHKIHHEILSRIPATSLYAGLQYNGQIVSSGLGVLEDEYFGVFDLVTATKMRNEGYGKRLVAATLRLAQKAGARYAYLQVTDSNQPAQFLYEKLGFKEAYYYWYRVKR